MSMGNGIGKSVLAFILLTAAGILLMAPDAPASARTLLYVGNSQGDDISVIDVAGKTLLTTIKVGALVHGVCAPADGRRAYATIESNHTVQVIDTLTNSVSATIPLPGRPNECAVTADGKYLVVPLLAPANSAVVIDTASRQIVKTFEVRHPHNCFTPEGGSNTIVYCEARDNFYISRIDLRKMEITNNVKVAGDPRPFAITADEKTLYTALSGLHGFATIDIANQTMSQTVLPPMPWMNCKVEPPNTPVHGIALTRDGRKLWITSVSDAGIYVYDLATKTLSPRIAVGACPNWISMSADGRYAGVSNADSDDTSILDVKSEKEIARIKVGKAPKRLLMIEVPQSTAAK
jgi:YVTN family beta-propeller protein